MTLSRSALALSLTITGVVSLPPTLAFAQPAAPAKAELPKFEDVTKDMQAVPGLVTFYRYDKDDVTKDQTRLLCLIPKQMLGSDLMMANSVSRGPAFGNPLDDGILVRFEQSGNRVMLMAPDTRLEEKGTIKDAVANTYQPAILGGFQILSTDGRGGVLVDLSPVLFSGVSGIGASSGMIRRENSKITKIKSFPENVLVDLDLAIGAPGQANSLVGVTYAFRKLPAIGSYTPRKADERVGYFTTVRQDWNAKYSDRENLMRYVNRWNIKKQDPSLDLSPPEKPITFIIERTVPIQFRKAVADGISEWNKAFEQIGITNAIVVQQQTDDNEFKDVDPEDARYNFIRWIVTGRGYAMGPSRPDPRTGQLLDADIVFDDAMVRFYTENLDIFGPKAASADLGASMVEFYRDNPAFLPAGAQLSKADNELLRASKEELAAQSLEPGNTAERNPIPWARSKNLTENRECSLGNGLRHQMAVARLAAAASGAKKLPDRLIAEVIKDIVSHEVGHTLGLRHNFKGSAWKSLDEIKKARDEGGQPWGSVMDYNAYLFFPGEKIEDLKHIASTTIGPYDYWAIAYGYTGNAQGKSEDETLAALTSQNTKKEYAYATDEDVMGLTSPDPTANRFDMGADPVAWAQMRISMADGLLANFKEWAAKKDEPNYYLRDVYSTLMFERARYIPFVAREITGQVQSRSRLGDPDAPAAFTQIEPKVKRDALKFIGDTLFTEAFFTNMSPELLNSLGVSRWSDWASDPAARTDYPVHSAVLSMQGTTLASLCSPQALTRVYDAEKKTKSDDKFTAAELITSVRDIVWSDLDGNLRGSDAKPGIGSFRRNLQQQYLQNMLSLAELKAGSSIAPDLQNMIRYALRDLSAKIGKSADKGADFATKAHLAEAKTRIDRVLDAPYVNGGGGGGTTIIMMGRDTGGVAPVGESK